MAWITLESERKEKENRRERGREREREGGRKRGKRNQKSERNQLNVLVCSYGVHSWEDQL